MRNIILIMGVSGSGKSTIGRQLSQVINARYFEADDYHPQVNINKMANGFPLNDDDRWPWLDALAIAIQMHDGDVVASCSALKEKYREYIEAKIGKYRLVYLYGEENLLKERISSREAHYMSVHMLKSQLEILEEPLNAIKIDVQNSIEKIVELIKQNMDNNYEIGVLGLGVMGKSLARNFADKKIPVITYNLPFPSEEDIVEKFIEKHGNDYLIGAKDISQFIDKLKKPRLILLMITAGKAVDDTIELLLPHLSAGDMIIDAGNTFYEDTNERYNYLKAQGLHFIGMGVSGGEEGALKGPSIMPAGDEDAKQRLLPLLQKICAIADGIPCVNWFGQGGGGHFVKMIHNGIEYADMQLISEAYDILRRGLGMSNEAIADHLATYQSSYHHSYLIDITIDILRKKINGESIIDQIVDVAGHKGTGVWTSVTALQMGIAVPTIIAAMNQRILSAQKQYRADLGKTQTKQNLEIDLVQFDKAFLFCRLIALIEGLHIINEAAHKNNWNFDLDTVLQTWRGGCIIRSEMLLLLKSFLKDINNPVQHLFEIEACRNYLESLYENAQQISSILDKSDIATPAFSAALQYYKTMHTQYLPINLIQAQRDYFGAHTLKLWNSKDQSVHIDWS